MTDREMMIAMFDRAGAVWGEDGDNQSIEVNANDGPHNKGYAGLVAIVESLEGLWSLLGVGINTALTVPLIALCLVVAAALSIPHHRCVRCGKTCDGCIAGGTGRCSGVRGVRQEGPTPTVGGRVTLGRCDWRIAVLLRALAVLEERAGYDYVVAGGVLDHQMA